MPSAKRTDPRRRTRPDAASIVTHSQRETEARLARQQADRRRQRILLLVSVLAVLVIVAGVGIGYGAWRSGRMPKPPAAEPRFGAVTITDGQPILLGRADAPVTVTLFEDFRCPHCADFTDEVGSALTDLQRNGTVKVELYPMSFVDPEHGSVSAANAMACAAAAGAGQAYYAGLFANYGLQWNDDQLIRLGQLVGLHSSDFTGCVRDQRHRPWLDTITKAAQQHKVEATPTVFINGVRKPDAPQWSAHDLRDQVRAAQ